MDDLSQAIGDNNSDRITQILQQNAASSQPPQQSMASSSGMPPSLQNYTPASIPQQQQITPMQVLAQKVQAGDPQANMLLKRTQAFTGGDPQATQSAMQFMIDHPNDIDPSNSYQVNTALAQWSRQSGFSGQQPMAVPAQSLQMPTNQQISMQDLGSIASGKGTNFLGLQQGAAQNIAELQFKQAQENRFNAMAQNGGMGGAGVVAANKIKSEWDSTHPDKPMSWTDAYMMATAKQGQGITVDPTTGQVINMAGAPQAAGTMENAKEGGKQAAEVAAAAPKAAAEAGGKATIIGGDALAADASQAQNLVYTLKDLQDVSQNVQMGALAPAKMQIQRIARAIGYPLSDQEINSLSSAQGFNKLAMNMVGAAAKQEGSASRLQAAFSALKDSNPNLGLEPETLPIITRYMGTQANKIITQQQAWNQTKNQNPATLYPDFERNYISDLSAQQQNAGGNLQPYNFGNQGNATTPKVTNWAIKGGKLVPQ